MAQPPNTSGVMTLVEADRVAIRTKLETIRSGFVPTDEQPICDTFYLVSTYNKANVGEEINGDTAEDLLR